MSRDHGRYAWACVLDRTLVHKPPSSARGFNAGLNIHVRIDYDDAPGTYRGVEAHRGKEVTRFNSGDPIKDWEALRDWLPCQNSLVMMSSSVNDFLTDEPGYRMIETEDGFERMILEDRPGFESEILVRWARDNLGEHRFINGSCHDLALALHEQAGGAGELRVGYRVLLEERGDVVPLHESYSHMVYVDPEGEAWDIGGRHAITRWERRLQVGEDPKTGHIKQVEWVSIEPERIPAFLQEWGGTSDPDILDRLRGAFTKPAENPAPEPDEVCRSMEP